MRHRDNQLEKVNLFRAVKDFVTPNGQLNSKLVLPDALSADCGSYALSHEAPDMRYAASGQN